MVVWLAAPRFLRRRGCVPSTNLGGAGETDNEVILSATLQQRGFQQRSRARRRDVGDVIWPHTAPSIGFLGRIVGGVSEGSQRYGPKAIVCGHAALGTQQGASADDSEGWYT